jgi:hypothetical protein
MSTQTPITNQTTSDKINTGLHLITIVMIGVFSIVATLRAAALIA